MRASYVWVVTDDRDSAPLAAFTVKHELVTWLKSFPLVSDHIKVWHIGGYAPRGNMPRRNELDVKELIK